MKNITNLINKMLVLAEQINISDDELINLIINSDEEKLRIVTKEMQNLTEKI